MEAIDVQQPEQTPSIPLPGDQMPLHPELYTPDAIKALWGGILNGGEKATYDKLKNLISLDEFKSYYLQKGWSDEKKVDQAWGELNLLTGIALGADIAGGKPGIKEKLRAVWEKITAALGRDHGQSPVWDDKVEIGKILDEGSISLPKAELKTTTPPVSPKT